MLYFLLNAYRIKKTRTLRQNNAFVLNENIITKKQPN